MKARPRINICLVYNNCLQFYSEANVHTWYFVMFNICLFLFSSKCVTALKTELQIMSCDQVTDTGTKQDAVFGCSQDHHDSLCPVQHLRIISCLPHFFRSTNCLQRLTRSFFECSQSIRFITQRNRSHAESLTCCSDKC